VFPGDNYELVLSDYCVTVLKYQEAVLLILFRPVLGLTLLPIRYILTDKITDA
jgi:hypothetical protein